MSESKRKTRRNRNPKQFLCSICGKPILGEPLIRKIKKLRANTFAPHSGTLGKFTK